MSPTIQPRTAVIVGEHVSVEVEAPAGASAAEFEAVQAAVREVAGSEQDRARAALDAAGELYSETGSHGFVPRAQGRWMAPAEVLDWLARVRSTRAARIARAGAGRCRSC